MKTVTVSLVNSVFYPASQKGVGKQMLLNAVGLDERILALPDNRVPCVQFSRLLEAATELSGDSNFPIYYGTHVQPASLSTLGYLIYNSPTVRHAYFKALQYNRIVGDGLTYDLHEQAETSTVTVNILDDEMLPYKRFVMEGHFSLTLTMMRQLLRQDVMPEAVYFAHEPPENSDDFEDLFGCKPVFNAKGYHMTFANAILDESIAQANPSLYQMLDQHAAEILKNIDQPDVVSKTVLKHIFELVHSNQATLDAVAERMGLGVRTLQRKLNEEGNSFNGLLSEVKKEIAVRHLTGNRLSISEISYLLGFAEPSVFHRSFKKWTGCTPSDFRRQNAI